MIFSPVRNSMSPVLFCIATFIIFSIILLILPSFPKIRAFLSTPLTLHNPDAHGEACYVLAGGGVIWERLDAAADLVQMGRVGKILLMQDNAVGQFSFKAARSWTKTEWMADYLAWRGVPTERIQWLPQVTGRFGSLTEARAVAALAKKDSLRSLVVVSSAPHMRRSVLAFERSLPQGVPVQPYAATTMINSYELHHPIWLEYLKLMVYYVIA